MAQGFSSGSSQASIILNAQAACVAGESLAVLDASGNEIFSYTPAVSKQGILISMPDLIQGETYVITSNGQTLGTTTAEFITVGTMGGNRGGL